MSKQENENQENANQEEVIKISDEMRKKIEIYIENKTRLSYEQEQLNEDLSAIAKELGVKKGVLSKRIGIIIKEQQNGGEILSYENDVEFVRNFFEVKDKNEYK